MSDSEELKGYPSSVHDLVRVVQNNSDREADLVVEGVLEGEERAMAAVAEAVVELKKMADFVEEETDNHLGAARAHRIADEAAEAMDLEVEVVENSVDESD